MTTAEHAVINAVENERLGTSAQASAETRDFLAVQRAWSKRWFYAEDAGIPNDVFIKAFRKCYAWFDLQDRET